jgi:hypothetical protein
MNQYNKLAADTAAIMFCMVIFSFFGAALNAALSFFSRAALDGLPGGAALEGRDRAGVKLARTGSLSLPQQKKYRSMFHVKHTQCDQHHINYSVSPAYSPGAGKPIGLQTRTKNQCRITGRSYSPRVRDTPLGYVGYPLGYTLTCAS